MLVVADGRVAVVGDPPQLALVEPAAVGDVAMADRWLLGIADDGAALFAVAGTMPEGTRGAGIRDIGALLSDRDAYLVLTAVALERWHATHTHCPRCGAPTDVAEGGMVRVCPVDASLHHPRVDPAVIMTVVDDRDRLLLGHHVRWPDHRFSTLAGFVEPGETLEQAVAREVAEETDIVVHAATYLGSQPWPFPRSLMLGFAAQAATTAITADGVEIAEARWFTRSELAACIDVRDVALPPRVSIARRLIEHWYGDALADG